jgi:hypothetical protein
MRSMSEIFLFSLFQSLFSDLHFAGAAGWVRRDNLD